MDEGRRKGRGESASGPKKAYLCAMTGAARIGKPQSWIFTVGREDGAAGTNGRRSQVGPEQGQGLLGRVASECGRAADLADKLEGPKGFRST
jgi:hypothetical protein